MKQIQDMTDEELVREWKDIAYHIRNFSFGSFELKYQEQLEEELERREDNTHDHVQ